MHFPYDLDQEALSLLLEDGWAWNPSLPGFLKTRNPDQQTTEEYRNALQPSISYGWLKDHGLIGASVSPAERAVGLYALQQRLS